MEKISLQKRDVIGKKVKKLLKQGTLPGVVYNSKGESQNIQLSVSDGAKLLNVATLTTIIDANLEGKNQKVIIKDVDKNPRTDEIRHISFFEIDEKQSMVFEVPFELTGISPAVKNNLGVLVQILSVLEVKCKSADLPSSIQIDISKLEFPGQSISVEDITLPKGLVLINEDIVSSPIVTITQLQKQEVIEEEKPEEEGEEGEEIEGEEGEEVETTEEGVEPSEESSEQKDE